MIRQLFKHIPIFLLLCLLGSGAPARAQGSGAQACPAAFPAVAAQDSVIRGQELELLLPLSASCLQRADFFAYEGQLFLLQGRFVDALAALERSLLLDSAQLGVQLDYVLALAKSGDLASARALAQQVLARDDAPAAMRQALEAVMRDEQKANNVLARWQWRGSVQTLAGRDSNLNSATSADVINLTLPNGNVSLLLDASSKPRSGFAGITTGHVTGQTGLEGGLLVVQGDWRERLAPSNSDFGYRQQDTSLLYRPYEAQAWAGRVAASSFAMGGTALFEGLSASTWMEFPGKRLSESISGCSVRTGLEAERRGYAQDRTQNGVYGSLNGLLLCAHGENNYQLGMQGGKDWASVASRAGGDQTRLDVKVAWERKWQWARTSAELITSRLQDSRAYSDLLGGVTRTTLRQNIRISVIKRLNSAEILNPWGGLYSVAVLEALRHKSNIVLFDVKGESLYAGLRYEF